MTVNLAPAPALKRDQTTWLAYLALGLFSYLETIPGPIMPFLQAELQISDGLASLHFAAFALGSICIGLASTGLQRCSAASPAGRRTDHCR